MTDLNNKTLNYNDLLLNALDINNEAKISKAYSVFHNYSVTNQILAVHQLDVISPIAPFSKWKSLGRQVIKGSKAIALYMPITLKEKDKNGVETGEEKTVFMLRKNWFDYNSTTGDDTDIMQGFESVKDWDLSKALEQLNISQVEYKSVNGNSQGYATQRNFAINPLAHQPLKTTFHELAHIELGHTDINDEFSNSLDKAIKEVEAEGVAFICCASLNLVTSEVLAESRGYIQSWLALNELDKRNAKRIFSIANKILKAGV